MRVNTGATNVARLTLPVISAGISNPIPFSSRGHCWCLAGLLWGWRAMPRFFFHFVSKNCSISDDKGRELANLSEAHRYAVLLIKQQPATSRPSPTGGTGRSGSQDVSNLPLLTVLFPFRSPDVAAPM